MRTRQKRVVTDTWRSLGCRTTPLEHWSRRKPTVEPRWAKQQTKKVRPKPTKINSFMLGPSLCLTPKPVEVPSNLLLYDRSKAVLLLWFILTATVTTCCNFFLHLRGYTFLLFFSAFLTSFLLKIFFRKISKSTTTILSLPLFQVRQMSDTGEIPFIVLIRP